MKAHTGPLPALPPVPFTPSRPMAIVQQVYEFAARHPEVLQHVPCYCGCERIGHNGNHDCFVKTRKANGPSPSGSHMASAARSASMSAETRCRSSMGERRFNRFARRSRQVRLTLSVLYTDTSALVGAADGERRL